MILFHILFLLVLLLTFLPMLKNQHWFFRLGDFLKVHVLYLSIILIAIGMINYQTVNPLFNTTLVLIIIFLAKTIIKYTFLYSLPDKKKIERCICYYINSISKCLSIQYQLY